MIVRGGVAAVAVVNHAGEDVAAGRVDHDPGETLLPGAGEDTGRVEVEQPGRVVPLAAVPVDDPDRPVELRHVQERVLGTVPGVGDEGDVGGELKVLGDGVH